MSLQPYPSNRRQPDWRNGLDWSRDPYGNPPLPPDYNPNDPRFQQPEGYNEDNADDPQWSPATARLSFGGMADQVVGEGYGAPAHQPMTPQAPTSAAQAAATVGLPTPPPSVRSSNPWAKENLSRTLADVGSAFLSNDGLAQGFGAAAKAISGRKEELTASQYGKRSIGGPNDSFEIVEHPDGRREYVPIQPFIKARQEEIRAQKGLTQKDLTEATSSLAGSIMDLPEAERAAAWAEVRQDPAAFGLGDISNLPAQWSNQWGQTASGIGLNAAQRRSANAADRTYNYQVGQDNRNHSFRTRQQDERERYNAWRMQYPPSRGGGGPTYGSDLDY